ncbi:MAG: hypothetical protein OT477_09840 [Chloroflexi bacterium]|nr:hypothetical protein [Chloroflexota bacterium]
MDNHGRFSTPSRPLCHPASGISLSAPKASLVGASQPIPNPFTTP